MFVGQLCESPAVVLQRTVPRSFSAGPRGTARRLPNRRRPGRSSRAGNGGDRSRAASETRRGAAASSSACGLPNCRYASSPIVLPAKGPTSAMSLPIKPAKCASAAARLSLSHSKPAPAGAAGELTAPVDVWPKRTTVHFPGGTSQASRPSMEMGGEVDDFAAGDRLFGRHCGKCVAGGSSRKRLPIQRCHLPRKPSIR